MHQRLEAQAVKVELGAATSADTHGFQVLPFLQTPAEPLVEPELGEAAYYYVALWHPGLPEEDPIISGIVIAEEEAETLFLDKNNDEDLTNDGLPDFFPSIASTFTFELMGENDTPRERVVFQRAGQGEAAAYVTKKGDLRPEYVAAIREREPMFDGTEGTFYIVSKPSLRHGRWQTANVEITIALYDANTNGVFNDASDLLLIDWNADGLFDGQTPTERIRLAEAVRVDGQAFRIEDVQADGSRLVLRPLNDDVSY